MFTNLINGPSGFKYPYAINQSCRFNFADTAFLNRTWAAAGNQRLWSFSTWFKMGNLVASDGYESLFSAGSSTATQCGIYFSSRKLLVLMNNNSGGTHQTDDVFRDPSSWYHVLCVYDSENGTADNRIRIYVNGVEVDKTISSVVPLNYDGYININSGIHAVGSFRNTIYSGEFDGYMAETNFIDGATKTPSDFGDFVKDINNNVWIPKRYSGSYGDEGFYLDYSNASHFGEDQSGNSNDFTDNGFSTDDQVPDTPTKNYCTFNPIDYETSIGTLTNGNLRSGGAVGVLRGSMSIPASGKWYFEWEHISTPGGANPVNIGIQSAEVNTKHDADWQCTIYSDNGANHIIFAREGGASTSTQNMPNYVGIAINDVTQVAYDADTGEIWFGLNNTWFDGSGGTTGNPSAGTNPTYTFTDATQRWSAMKDHAGATFTIELNCGQLGFAYSAPTGFKELKSLNITALSSPFDDYVSCATENDYSSGTYTGTGSADGPVVLIGYKPTNVCIDGTSYDGSSGIIDILANGFKLRHASTKNVNTTVYNWEAWVKQDHKRSNAEIN